MGHCGSLGLGCTFFSLVTSTKCPLNAPPGTLKQRGGAGAYARGDGRLRR